MNTDIEPIKTRTIIRSEILGYCMGVRRAVQIAESALKDNPEKKVYTLGPLIHNNQALEMLENKGLSVLLSDSIETLCNEQSVVIIRAHGVPPQTMKRLNKTGCLIINATCPRVLANQHRAKKYFSHDYTVFLAGDKDHGEVKGIAGHAQGRCIIVKNKEDVESLQNYPQKSVLIGQTTISYSEYDEIAKALKDKIPSLEVFDTICPATVERQDALKDLAQKVDGILVIGGKHSANTQRLYTLSSSLVKNTVLIENADEIPASFFTLERVGLTAGASTPDEIIDKIENCLL